MGKTNLLDAIYYCCFTKSYFAKSDQQSVRSGFQGFRIESDFRLNEEALQVVCILRETGRKEFLVNGEPYEKLSRHIGRLPCVIIAPDDVQIISGGSEERRRFLDALLSQLDATYLQQLIEYNKVLLQRNGFLKTQMGKPDWNLLDVYDSQLVRPGLYIFEKRRAFLQDFLPLVTEFYKKIAGEAEPVTLGYDSQLEDTAFPDLLRRWREKDLYLQRTGSGVHKDDIVFRYTGELFKSIASQGQRKSLLFALILSEYESLKKDKGFPPLLLLDDVFEKLDEKRMHNLLDWVCNQNEGQVIITDTHAARLRQALESLGQPFTLISLPEK
jgi:DNA replication and repair protein RecF